MKKMFIAAAMLTLLTSCMDARDRSAAFNKVTDGGTYYDKNNDPNYDRDEGSSGTYEPTTPTDDSDNSNIPTEARNCTWSSDGSSNFQSNTNHLGSINVCQSNTTDTNIFVQLKTPLASNQKLCAIPMYDNGSNAVYIGNPRCIFVNDSEIKQIPLLKNRGNSSQYAQFNVTAVMLIKDLTYRYPSPFRHYQNPNGLANAVDAFLFCMNWIDQTNPPDGKYCTAFKSINEHVYFKF